MTMPDPLRPTWITINLGAIRRNARRLVTLAADKNVKLIAVVKANAYGHGAIETAGAALSAGIAGLAVALPEEGIALRNSGIQAPILVMGAYVPGTAEAYVQHGLTATLSDPAQAEAIATEVHALGGKIKVHLKVDTGMGRLGVLPPSVEALVRPILSFNHVEIEGVYSHLATAEEIDPTYAHLQVQSFDRILRAMSEWGVKAKQRHILNSGGLLQHGPGLTNVARVGLVLHGVHPADHLRSVIDLEPAMSFSTQVVSVKRVPPGTFVSYGRRYQTKKSTQLAALPVGYADGLSRGLSHRVSVMIGGQRFPLVGSICMDQAIVDVGDATIVPGDEVILFGGNEGNRPRPQEWAEAL